MDALIFHPKRINSQTRRATERRALPAEGSPWSGYQSTTGSWTAGEILQYFHRLMFGPRWWWHSPLLLALMSQFGLVTLAETKPTPDYATVQQIFTQHCLDCHAAQEPEAKLVLENFESLMKGGESGSVIVPGRSQESLLVKMIEGKVEREGKKRIMPPGKREKLRPEEIAAVKTWIDAGATGPQPGVLASHELVVPDIRPKVPPRRSVDALAYAAGPKLLAVGRYGQVELLSADSRNRVRTLAGHRGAVNALVFSKEGDFLYAAGGEAGLFGEVTQWKVSDGTVVRTFKGHRDALYALALSPDGKILATGSYDQKIKLWNTESGSESRTLSGHNGAIFDLAFRPDGKILASASADRTVKLWDVATGERRDTLSQSLKEVYAVSFSADGKRLFAGGADNRIRMWEISDKALETTNPILESRFAHEGTIVKLVLSSDGKSLGSAASDALVKLWDTTTLDERLALEKQPDWPSALAFTTDDKTLVVARLDGSFEYYNTVDGKVLPPPKPELVRAEPRGFQRGTTQRVKLIGSHLANLTEIQLSDNRLHAERIQGTNDQTGETWFTLSSTPDLPRGAYELSVRTTAGESGRIKLFADDLPQVYLDQPSGRTNYQTLPVLPVSVWGTLQKPGQVDVLAFEAKAGQHLVFDLGAKEFGSKADAVLDLYDAKGNLLESSNGFDNTRDPLFVHTFDADGEYRLSVNELVLGASPDHFYRLSIGSFPYVTGCFPLSVPMGRESSVELVGYNLPAERKLTLRPEKAGETALPLDPEKFRSRREFRLIVSEMSELVEAEPNDTPAQAMTITPPCAVGGRLWSNQNAPDTDLFRFEAKAGQKWIVETAAAQRGSPADTKIEVLHADGTPVQRLLLQAVRDSAVTFRGIDSDTMDCRVNNWEEMELNQYLYLQGEVVRLLRAPQGPDSGFLFYGLKGKRRCYFDTSATAHAVDEPCYIVEPRPPGAKLVPNGLPVFPIYSVNDDDADRKLGTDSKLHFTPPADGTYLIRVTDTRGFSGERFSYRLVVRKPQPDFQVTLHGAPAAINAGSGQSFSLEADRTDGFEGEINVTIEHLPTGFVVSSPLVIEQGQTEASGTLYAATDGPSPSAEDWAKVEITASAQVDGRAVVKAVNTFGAVKRADPPKLFVALEPEPAEAAHASSPPPQQPAHGPAPDPGPAPVRPREITIVPGQSVPALLRVRRNGYDDLITFTVENLPHGVIVDNIGLNGVLIPKGQAERQIFLTAAKWVPDTDRLCFAVESQAGRQTSLPVLLHVRKAKGLQAAVSQ